MPNTFAYAVIMLWPLAGLWLYKRFEKQKAIVLLVLLPFLFLPVNTIINLPAMPAMHKGSIGAITAFCIAFFISKDLKLLPETDFARRLIYILFLFPVFTVLANGDTLYYGSRTLSSLGFSDYINIAFSNFALAYVPFILGYNYLKNENSHKIFLTVIVGAGLIYSLPIIYEVLMSPQLHSKIYGFFPHSWSQQKRDGGFRPVVFLGHGLVVAIFICWVTISAVTLFKEKIRIHAIAPPILIVFFFIFVLLACKSMGALLISLIIATIILLTRPKIQVLIATILVLIVFLFPFFRSNNLIPTEGLVTYIEDFNESRSSSLNFRFENENILLEKANVRKLFGWGTWGRNRVYNPINGKDLSVTDGSWIIVFGQFGWLGYISIFGLLVYPVIRFRSVIGKLKPDSVSIYSSSLCLLITANLIDMIPNSSMTQLSFLFAGSILGNSELLLSRKDQNASTPTVNS